LVHPDSIKLNTFAIPAVGSFSSVLSNLAKVDSLVDHFFELTRACSVFPIGVALDLFDGRDVRVLELGEAGVEFFYFAIAIDHLSFDGLVDPLSLELQVLPLAVDSIPQVSWEFEQVNILREAVCADSYRHTVQEELAVLSNKNLLVQVVIHLITR